MLMVLKSSLKKMLKFSCCMLDNLEIYFLCITYTTGLKVEDYYQLVILCIFGICISITTLADCICC